jgi:hypothetical protein
MRFDLSATWHAPCVHNANTRSNPRCGTRHAWNDARAEIDGGNPARRGAGYLYPVVNMTQTRTRPRAGADAARHGHPRQYVGGGAHALAAAQQHARSGGLGGQQAGAVSYGFTIYAGEVCAQTS